MSTFADSLADSRTMVRRVLHHTRRNPAALIISFVVPLLMLLLFTYAFGGAVNTGGVLYLNYVAPGILILGVAYSVQATALSVHADVSEGIIDRFRTMDIARSAVLIGHVIGSTLRTLAGLVVLILVAWGLGFHPTANLVQWLAVLGILALTLFAFAWLGTAFGLAAKTSTGVGSLSLLVTMLPFLSGAFVPTGTMPGWLQVFTGNQPMTQVIDTVRGLLLGSRIGNHGWLALAWCVGITLAGYGWAHIAFNRRSPGDQSAQMLTIGQVAAHVGVTVKAVRHYHRLGLLAEPARDDAGYRRYNAQAVIDLTRIKVLRDAGIPLAQIPALLRANHDTLTATIDHLERDLDARIRTLRRHKMHIRQLVAGDSLYLAPAVVALLEHLRGLGVPDAVVEMERDGWIIWSVASPHDVDHWAKLKLQNLADPEVLHSYLMIGRACAWSPDDPRLIDLAHGWATAQLAAKSEVGEIDFQQLESLNPTTVALITDRFAATSPAFARLIQLVEEQLHTRTASNPEIPAVTIAAAMVRRE